MSRYRRSHDSSGWMIGVGLVVVVLIFLGSCIVGNSNRQVMTCTVTDKDRTTTREGQSDMRIYTEDCGTLSVGDNLANGVFNSADTYSKIDPGSTYQFTTVGHRIGILSAFPTILEVEEVDVSE